MVLQLEQTKVAAEKQVADLTKQAQVAQSEMTAAATQMKTMQEQKTPIDQQKTTQEQQTQAASQLVTHWQGQATRLKGEIEFNAAMEKISAELDGANQELEAQDIALQNVEQKLAAMEQELAAQKTNKLICSDWTGIVRVFKRDDGAHLGDYDTNPPILQDQLKHSETQLVAANEKHAPLLAQFNATVAKVNELTAQIQSAQQIVTQAESKLNEYNKQLGTVKPQL